MKTKISLLILAVMIYSNGFAQFFDSVPYRGAFGVNGTTKNISSGYNPDPTNNSADWSKPWANWSPNATAYPGDAGYNSSNPQFYTVGTAAEKVVLSGDIASDLTLSSNKWYEISGTIHVLNGATLTIPAGTCLRGSTSNIGVLIIAKGGKLNAVGTKDHPIVITSGKPAGSRVRADWGGLLLIGNAHTNTPGGARQYEALPSDPLANYGGGLNPNDADNSGTMRYMRFEFAGFNYLPDQEINGITFAGVGSGTKADYLMVSFSNDDNFEWFGGAVNHKYLISFASTDDEFDMDEGYNGKCQYLLGVRNPAVFETSPTGTSNGLEHDNNTGLGTSGVINPSTPVPTPTTAPIISNMTLVGPIKAGSNRTTLSTTANSRFGRALEYRTNVSTSVFNSVIWGYPTLFQLGNPSGAFPATTQTRAFDDQISLRNSTFISTATGSDVRFNSQNAPIYNLVNLGTSWMRTWLINGPTVGFTGATDNDTVRTTLTVGTEFTNPIYLGTTNGALNQLDFSGVDYTLAVGSPFANASNFSHPKIAVIPSPSVAVTASSLAPFNIILGQPLQVKWVVLTASALAGNINITAPTNFEISWSRTTGWAANISKNGPTVNDTIFVRFNRTSTGSNNGFLNISSTVSADFSPLNIALNGTAVAPAAAYLSVTESSLSFNNAVGASTTATFSILGKNLVDTVSLVAPANFEISLNATSGFAQSLTLNNPVKPSFASTLVYVKYNPTAASTHSGNLVISSKTIDPINIALAGNSAATLTSSPAQLTEIATIAGIPSLAYAISLSGVKLSDTVKVVAPAGFQLSIDSVFTTPVTTLNLNIPTAAVLANTKVYVRYSPISAGTISSNVTISSTGATTRNIAVAGRSLAPSAKAVFAYSSAFSLVFTTIFTTPAVPSASQLITVSGMNLGTDSLVLTAPSGFEVSLDNSNYVSVIKLANTAGIVSPTMVYVRYNPVVQSALNQQLYVHVSSANPSTTSSATNVVMFVNGNSSPAITVNSTVEPTLYTTFGKPSVASSVVVSGTRLVDNVIATAPTGFELSLDSVNFTASVTINKTGTTLANTKVYIRFNPSVAGASAPNSFVSFNTVNGAAVPVAVSGIAVVPATPIVSLSTATLPMFATNGVVPTAPVSFTFNAQNLVTDLAITVGNDFELSNDSITYKNTWNITPDVDGNIGTTKLFCRFKRATTGSVSDSIKFNSANLVQQAIALTGKNTTGIIEVNSVSALKLYPNPASSQVAVEFELIENSQVTIAIVDLTGKIVGTSVSNQFNKGFNSVEIPTSDLLNGFYFVNIVSEKGAKTAKLSVIK
ncbi:MAG: T9SS type A sorting domain-containing protein [Bacteroidia bacterium]